MKIETNLAKANRLFREKKLKESLDLYNCIKNQDEAMSRIVDVNIKLVKKALMQSKLIDAAHENSFSKNLETNKYLPYEKIAASELYKSVGKSIISRMGDRINDIADIKVSIIVPAYNCASIISETLKSLTNQSHSNIEIIVVDDASDDDTLMVVKRFAKNDERIKFYKLAKNMGTYFARSYGVDLATGSYVTFNDADDYSHEMRIQLHLIESLIGNYDVTTSNYIRYNPFTGQSLETHGKIEHYGFITTFAHKTVFSKIGFFDLTTRGGDAEFSLRLKKFYLRNKIKHLACPTYLAAQMQGSLTAGEINAQIQEKQKSLSYSRKRYAAHFAMQQRFFESADKCSDIFAFPMLRSPYRQPDLMKVSVLDDYLVYGCMCTIPSRKKVLLKAFKSVICQVDKLYIYPDKYEENLPVEIISHPNVVVISTKKYPNLGAGGKFLPLFSGMLDDLINEVIYFTFDDDIEYPKDYVHALSKSLEERQFHCVLGVHGTIVNEGFENYKQNRTVFHFRKALNGDRLVDVIGTGTTAFKASLLRNKFFYEDVYPYMIDIALARVCRRNSLPVVCLSRQANWLIDLSREIEDDESSIWNTLVAENAISHTTALMEYGKNTWGNKAIEQLVANRCIYFNAVETQNTQAQLSWMGKVPALLHFYMPSNGTYKITLIIKNEDGIQNYVSLKNSLSGKLIMKRAINKGIVSFSVNAALNTVITCDFSEVVTESSPNLNVTASVEHLYPEAMPRKYEESLTAIHAALATYPPREACLSDILSAVGHNVDNLCFYLNRYQSPPQVILDAINDKERESSIHYIIDSDGSPKASGKFRWLTKKGYIFTLDDDILYPNDYFEHLIAWIEKLKRRAFVGVHGVIFNEIISVEDEKVKAYIKEKINFSEELSELKKVHMIGTGTLAFHSSLVDGCIDLLYHQMNHLKDCENSNDESLAVFAKKNNLPMYIVPRRKNWMNPNKKVRHGIHEEHFSDPNLTKVTRILLAEGNPWK